MLSLVMLFILQRRLMFSFMMTEGLKTSYLFLDAYLYYKIHYWSDSLTKHVTRVRPALATAVVSICFPKGCTAL